MLVKVLHHSILISVRENFLQSTAEPLVTDCLMRECPSFGDHFFWNQSQEVPLDQQV